MPKIGLIAGNGRYPINFASSAQKCGHKVVAVAIKEETYPELANYVDEIHWFNVGELQAIIDTFLQRGITRIVMAGKITKARMFNELKPDARLVKVFEKTPLKSDDALLKALASEFVSEGIEVCDSTMFLKSLLPQKGVLTKRQPTQQEMLDIDYGYKIAKKIAELDIGMTVVVKNRAILAVEAIEGTDETILRGSKYGNGDIVVVKVARPHQDMRFDLPVIGLDTIKTCKSAKVTCLGIESEKTLILDKDEVISNANDNNLTIVAI